jgi:hypothetical protein
MADVCQAFGVSEAFFALLEILFHTPALGNIADHNAPAGRPALIQRNRRFEPRPEDRAIVPAHAQLAGL